MSDTIDTSTDFQRQAAELYRQMELPHWNPAEFLAAVANPSFNNPDWQQTRLSIAVLATRLALMENDRKALAAERDTLQAERGALAERCEAVTDAARDYLAYLNDAEKPLASDEFKAIRGRVVTLACKLAALSVTPQERSGWQPIETAPKDGTLILVHAPAREGLPPLTCPCAYHPDAGFCVDELREPAYWMPLPAPPAESPKGE